MKCHERQFECPHVGCTKSFKQKQHLKNHLLTHSTDVRPFKCTHQGCGKAFKSISHLKDHTQSIHMKLKPFECQFCKSVFSRNSSLKFHIKSIHASLLNQDGSLNESAYSQLQMIKEQKPVIIQPPAEKTAEKVEVQDMPKDILAPKPLNVA